MSSKWDEGTHVSNKSQQILQYKGNFNKCFLI